MMTTIAPTWDPQTDSGQLLPITVVAWEVDESRGGSLRVVGPMGEEMRESMEIAMTLAQHTMAERMKQRVYYDIIVTLGVDEEVMYDGPSAGLAIYISAMGAMLGWESSPEVAVTGEVKRDGSVIRVGGIKNKMRLAALGLISTVLVPVGNAKALNKGKYEDFGGDLDILGVSHVDEVSLGEHHGR